MGQFSPHVAGRVARDELRDALLGRFLDYTADRGLSLYPAQEEAILELFEDKNVILNTPTGSGKSLVASALHFDSLARKRRSVYTCPIGPKKNVASASSRLRSLRCCSSSLENQLDVVVLIEGN